MRANTDLSLRLQFDRDADLYDRARPHYPSDLFDTITQQGDLKLDAHILEVGCGTGQATIDLANAGYRVTAIEPGANLATRARENCTSLPNIDIQNDFFETWDAGSQKFDAIISANAWHWIPPEISYAKAASLLMENGHLALFWNFPEIADPGISHDIKKIVDEMAPEAHGLSCYHGAHQQLDTLLEQGLAEFMDSGYFTNITCHTFINQLMMNADEFVDWLGTYANIQALPQSTRQALNHHVMDYVKSIDSTNITLNNIHMLRMGKKYHPR